MADLVWSLVPPVLLVCLIVALLRGFAGTITSAITGKAPKPRDRVKVWGLVFRGAWALAGLGVAALAGVGRLLVVGAERGSAATAGAARWLARPDDYEPIPRPWERHFWWKTAEEVHFDRWERDHFRDPGED